MHELMQLGGWQSYVMVLRYAHLAPEHLTEAASKIGIGETLDKSGINGAVSQNRTVDPIITKARGHQHRLMESMS